MKHIYKKISLEPLKCRCSNTLLAFKDRTYLRPYENLFYYDNPNGNYNSFPSDIVLPTGFTFTSNIITSYTKSYNFSSVTELTNTSVNMIKNYSADSYNWIEDGKYFYPIISFSDGSISYDGGYTKCKVLTYRKLHNWYKFFIFYFRLLHTTACEKSEKVYKSAEEYYYSDNEKTDDETLEYFQNLDKVFIKRGGVLGTKTKEASCDLFDWMRDFIFIQYDLNLSTYTDTDGNKYQLKKYASEWKNTILDINAVMQWYSWFGQRYKYFSGKTCSEIDFAKITEYDCCDCEKYQKLGGDIMFKFLEEQAKLISEKSSVIRTLCTNTAEINIQVPIQNYTSNLGELSPLYDEWEDNLDLSTKYNSGGNILRFGGVEYLNKKSADDNTTYNVQDNIYVCSASTKPSYSSSTYNEGYFTNFNTNRLDAALIDGYGDYLTYYIKNKSRIKIYPKITDNLDELYQKYNNGEIEFHDAYGALSNGMNKDVFIEYIENGELYYYVDSKEFNIDDNKELSTYSYNINGEFIRNPEPSSMCIEYSAVTATSPNHLYFIDDKIYESFSKYVLVDYRNNIVLDTFNNPYFIYYANEATNSLPYIIYKGKKIFGDYNNGKYSFALKKMPIHEDDWYYISTNTAEYIKYDNDYYKVDDKSLVTIEYNKMYTEHTYITYHPIVGYIGYNVDNVTAVISQFTDNTGGTYYACANDTISGFVETDNTIFHTRIKNVSNYDTNLNKVKGYWIDYNKNNVLTLHYLEPYTVYPYGYVCGKAKSRLAELEDFDKSYDKVGNVLNGHYCGTNLVPNDEEVLDIPFHVGNISDLSVIDTDDSQITKTYEFYYDTNVGALQRTPNASYYWGNIISEIEFYFKDENDDIIQSTIVKVPQYFSSKGYPTDDMTIISNLDYINDAMTKYFTSGVFCKNSKSTDVKNLTAITDSYEGEFVWESDGGYVGDGISKLAKITDVEINDDGTTTIVSCEEYDLPFEILNVLPSKLYCKITYNLGAIIQRPYTKNKDIYYYGLYALSKYKDGSNEDLEYHHGVEYDEEFTLGVEVVKYYTDYDNFFNTNVYTLTPVEKVNFYMEDDPDVDSDEYEENIAHFKMETVPDLGANCDDKKYTRKINTSMSDGRQFSFFNGLTAIPNIREEYNLGASSLRNVTDNIYINRGANYAFDKHIKLLEVKSFEALEQYGNGFFNIISNNDE